MKPSDLVGPVSNRPNERAALQTGPTSAVKPIDAKPIDRQVGATLLGEIGEDLPYYRGEFEAVARESAGQADVRMLRMHVEDEVTIRRQRVQANFIVAQSAIGAGQVLGEKATVIRFLCEHR